MKNKEYYKAIFQVIKTGHWFTDSLSQELKEYGISEPQYNALRSLKSFEGKPMTVVELSERMIQRSSNVTRIIDKLIFKNLVIRQECPSNRRKVDIVLTQKGQDFLKILDKKVYEFHEPMINKLTSDELTTLKELIQKLRK